VPEDRKIFSSFATSNESLVDEDLMHEHMHEQSNQSSEEDVSIEQVLCISLIPAKYIKHG